MQQLIKTILTESAKVKNAIASDSALLSRIEQAATKLRTSASAGGTIYACGNGGSACDAMHFCEELVARYKRERPGIRAMHFQDTSTISCWANDYNFETAYERQAETFCTDKDVLVAISTSGNSKNVLRAVTAAKAKGCFTIGLSGKDGGALARQCDMAIVVPAKDTERIQEAHITIIHAWCELLES